MVRLPICDDCASGRELCPVDRDKLERGLISELDIHVSRVLYDLDSYYRIGDDVELVHAYDMGSFILLLVKGEISRLIGKRGRVLKAIRERLGKPVRIVEVGVDLKKSIQDLFAGARVVGVSKVKTRGGDMFKIYIFKRDARFIPFPFKDVEKALEVVVPGKFAVEFVD